MSKLHFDGAAIDPAAGEQSQQHKLSLYYRRVYCAEQEERIT
jgi:hypothetical protein